MWRATAWRPRLRWSAVLGKVIHAEKPVLIEIEVPQGDEVSPWEFIHPGNPQAHLNRK